MNAFKRIINSLKDKRNEAHEKNVRKRAELMFQVTEYDHELWFTHNGMLFCPCCMISGEPTDVLSKLRSLYYERNV
jgi:hypothetical protein